MKVTAKSVVEGHTWLKILVMILGKNIVSMRIVDITMLILEL